MTELTPVGLSRDGAKLVLISDRGEEYTVVIDHRLRAALRGDHVARARLGQLEMTMDSTLRPRDIQTRIRGGESAEEVAAAAQTTVDKIMGFAAPVLAERAHIAQSAQASSVRRRSADAGAGARTLGESVLAHLSRVGVRDEEVTWDAWRRDDGRWTLVADYTAGGTPRHAEFTYDQPGRYVVADDDEARLLTGELSTGPAPAQPSGRRLSAVPAQDELPLGDDAIELVRDQPDAAPGRPSLPHGAPEEELTADHGDADWIASTEEPDAPALDETDEPEEPETEAAPSGRAKKKGRASVPSWDEIMFGGGRNE